MTVVALKTPTGLYYRASMKQKGVSVSVLCKSRIEAIVTCWQNFTYYLYK